MILIYETTATTFTDNGLGGLSPTVCRVKEALNNDYSLSMTHPMDAAGKWAKIAKQRIIKVPTHDGDQVFRIYSVNTEIIPGSVVVEARHIFYDLLGNFIEDTRPEGVNGAAAGTAILAGCQYSSGFTFSSDIAGLNTAYYVRQNPVQALIGSEENSFINRWGGEIRRNIFAIIINTRRGADNSAKITYRKNLIGLKISEDTTNLATRLFPICTGAGNTVIILPEKYVDSARISDYPHPRVAIYRITDIEVGSDLFPTDTEVYAEMRLRCAAKFADGIDLPGMTFAVNLVELSKTEEYRSVAPAQALALGDDVTVMHADLGIDLSLRVIQVQWDCLLEKYISVTIGDRISALDDYLSAVGKDIDALKNATSSKWFDERSKNIIPCYNSQVAAPVDAYNIAIIQSGFIARGAGTGKRNIAIGPFAEVTGDENIVAGDTAKANGAKNISIGDAAETAGETNIAMGSGAGNPNEVWDNIYMGNGAVGGSGDDSCVVLGYHAQSDGTNNVVVGPGNTAAAGGDNTVLGHLSKALADYGIAFGYAAESSGGYYAIAIGAGALAQFLNAIAIGQDAKAKTGPHNIAIGALANAASSDGYGIALGYLASIIAGKYHIAIGERAECQNADGHSVVIGYRPKSYGSYDIAIGDEAIAGDPANAGTQYENIAIGASAIAGYKDTADGIFTLNVAIGRSAAVGAGRQNVCIGRMTTVLRGDYNNVLGSLGWVQDGHQNILIPIGDLQVYCKGDKNIIIGNAYYYNGLAGAADEDKRILIGWVGSGGIPLMHGHSDDGLTFQSQGITKTPLRAKVLAGQTANAITVLDPSDAILGGFEANGGAASIVNRNGGAAVKQSISDLASIPAEVSRVAGTKYLIEPTDAELAKYRAMISAFDSDIWGAF